MQRQAFETVLAAYEREPLPGPVAWVEPPAVERLSEVRVPTLIVVGERDFEDFRAIADALAAGIASARQVVLEDAPHMVALERPDEARGLIREFLAGVLR
jgi:pimeloyl-ACP methyl ester carboxylesterase